MRGAALLGTALALCAAPAWAAELPAGSDPVVSEFVHACNAAIDNGTLGEGWTSSAMNDDSQAYLRHDEVFGDREFPGIGSAHLRATLDRYPGVTLGWCGITSDAAETMLPFGDIGKAEGLTGKFDSDTGFTEGEWRNADKTLFISAKQIADMWRIRFEMTRIDEAADAGN